MSQHPWLVVIDMQQAFGDPSSGWVAEGYAAIVPAIERLVAAYGERVVFTRFVRDPAEVGQWARYYDAWTEFRTGPSDDAWQLTLDPVSYTVIDEPTFSKWGPQLARVVGDAPLVLAGVATECCVLATAFGAADEGREVMVAADACAGATTAMHQNALEIMGANAPLISVATSAALLSGRR